MQREETLKDIGQSPSNLNHFSSVTHKLSFPQGSDSRSLENSYERRQRSIGNFGLKCFRYRKKSNVSIFKRYTSKDALFRTKINLLWKVLEAIKFFIEMKRKFRKIHPKPEEKMFESIFSPHYKSTDLMRGRLPYY